MYVFICFIQIVSGKNYKWIVIEFVWVRRTY